MKGLLRAQRRPPALLCGGAGGFGSAECQPEQRPISHPSADSAPGSGKRICAWAEELFEDVDCDFTLKELALASLAFRARTIPLSSCGQFGTSLGEPPAEVQRADAHCGQGGTQNSTVPFCMLPQPVAETWVTRSCTRLIPVVWCEPGWGWGRAL